MRSNKISSIDLFTQSANEHFHKHIKTKSKQALEVLKTSIDWDALVQPLASELAKHRSAAPAGRKRFDLKVIVRCFILQRIYGLSDPRLEEEIADRRSFQIFLDLTSGDAIPDETTICRYRELFARLGLDTQLHKSFRQQLKAKGLILEKGTIVDATLKVAQATSRSGRDRDARHTRRRHKVIYGYKGHIAVDTHQTFIHSAGFTAANIHDSRVFDQLLHHKEQAVFADKGYANQGRTRALRQSGVYCGIMDKAYRNRPLSVKQKRRNRRLSSTRNQVERPFAYFTRVLGYGRCSYYDLSRNRFEFLMAVVVYNMRRYMTVAACAP
jgi:IS5 family transposase